MKKMFLFFVMLLSFIVAFAQGGVDPPTSGFWESFATISGVASLTLLITGWIKTALKLEGKWARWLSWTVSVLLSLFGWWQNVGLFELYTWWMTIIAGFGIGLVANGIFTAETVQIILAFFKAQVKIKQYKE